MLETQSSLKSDTSYKISPREGRGVICSHTQHDLHVSWTQPTNFWLGVILDTSSYSMITSSNFPCESLSQFLLSWEVPLSFRKEHNLLWTFTISPLYYLAASYKNPRLHWLKKYGFVFLIKWKSGGKWLLALAQYFRVRVNVSVILLTFPSRFESGCCIWGRHNCIQGEKGRKRGQHLSQEDQSFLGSPFTSHWSWLYLITILQTAWHKD